MEALFGELAAVATAALFGVSSSLFTLSGRRVGPTNVNRARLLVASLLACGLHRFSRGAFLPLAAPPASWAWLGLSGIVGLAAGDALLFRAYVRIGPALSMLVFALAPALAALLSWPLLGETLDAREWCGIAITLSGIAWVVSERRRRTFVGEAKRYGSGILFAVGGALGQALGLITAKLGLSLGVVAQSANVMRLVTAAAAVWTGAVLTGGAMRTLGALETDRRAGVYVVAGSIAGPFCGVWLSLVAIERAPVGVASTLMSLTPIFLLPVGRILFGEPITYRAIAGTVLALSGAALLFR
jgi:drug/metabolite transporter (DMT)-like permease